MEFWIKFCQFCVKIKGVVTALSLLYCRVARFAKGPDLPSPEKSQKKDNTKHKASRLKGHVSKWNAWIFGRLHRMQKDRLHNKMATEKGSPPAHPFHAIYPFVQPTENSRFPFGNTALQPANPLFSFISKKEPNSKTRAGPKKEGPSIFSKFIT